MRINHNISALNTHRQMAVNTSAASKSMEKLSSGLRINRAADDAAGLSISEKMRSQIRGLNQATSNAQDGVSLIQTAEGALNEVSDMLTRMKELAVQKANGTYSADDKANINAELTALTGAINQIIGKPESSEGAGDGIDGTKFNGIKVFQEATTIAYGEDAGTTLTISAATVTKTNALTNASTVTQIDEAITEINTQRATYGAAQNQLEHVINNQNTTSENIQASESRIRDVDMAKEMMNFTKNNILLQAAQSMLAQANSQPQGVLQLLQ